MKFDCAILFDRYNEKLNNISETDDISEKLENLVKNYSEIFSSKLRTINGVKAKVNVEAN